MAISGNLPPIDFVDLADRVRLQRMHGIHERSNELLTTLAQALNEALVRGDEQVSFSGNFEVEKAIQSACMVAPGAVPDSARELGMWESREQIEHSLQILRTHIQENNTKL